MTVEWGEKDDESRPLASNAGWSDFGRWADTLDPTEYRQVVHLWEHGYVRDVPGLAADLDAAIKHSPPQEHSVHDTAEGLLRTIRAATKADHLAVTNGMGKDEGEDQWDEEAADYDPQPAERQDD